MNILRLASSLFSDTLCRISSPALLLPYEPYRKVIEMVHRVARRNKRFFPFTTSNWSSQFLSILFAWTEEWAPKEITQMIWEYCLPSYEISCGRNAHILQGHTDRVLSLLTFSLDGAECVISASDDGTLRVYGLAVEHPGQQLPVADIPCQVLQGHDGAVLSLTSLTSTNSIVSQLAKTSRWNSDSCFMFASGSQDCTIRIWKMTSTYRGGVFQGLDITCVTVLRGHTQGVRALTARSSTCLISASYDNTIKVWDITRGECVQTMACSSSIYCLVPIPKTEYFLSGGFHSFKVWDLRQGKMVQSFDNLDSIIYSLVLLPQDETRCFSASSDGLHTWKIGINQTTVSNGTDIGKGASGDTFYLVQTLGEGEGEGEGDKFQMEPKLLPTKPLTICGEDIRSLCVLPTSLSDPEEPLNQFVACGDVNGKVKIWDVRHLRCVKQLEGHESCVSSLSVLEGSRRLVSASYDGTIRVWSFEKDVTSE